MLGALAAGLMACTTETGSQFPLPPPPEPEVVFESEAFIERVVSDGPRIYVSLTDRQRKPKAQIVRVNLSTPRVLVEDVGFYGSIVAHDGLVDYDFIDSSIIDGGETSISLRRVNLDGSIDVLNPEWGLDGFRQCVDGWIYGKMFGIFGSGWLWRMPADGPYELETFSNERPDETLNDFVVDDSSIWLSVDNCSRGFAAPDGSACSSRLERMELGPLDPPRTVVVTESTEKDDALIESVKPSGARAAYLFGKTLKLVDSATKRHVVLAEGVMALLGIHEDAAIVRVLAFDESSELLRVPLDGSTPTSIARVPPLGSSWNSAIVEGALFTIGGDGHRLYRIPL
jgi:hypothetical protein